MTEMVIGRDNQEHDLAEGEWQCGECGRIHAADCNACCCLTHEECDCGQSE